MSKQTNKLKANTLVHLTTFTKILQKWYKNSA